MKILETRPPRRLPRTSRDRVLPVCRINPGAIQQRIFRSARANNNIVVPPLSEFSDGEFAPRFQFFPRKPVAVSGMCDNKVARAREIEVRAVRKKKQRLIFTV